MNLGGLRVRTTLDMRMQDQANATVRRIMNDPKHDPRAALVAIDPRSGAVRAMYGGRSFKSRQFNYATDSVRQAGSTMKPFVLAQALNAGISANTVYPGPAELIVNGEDFKNYGDTNYGPMTLRDATRLSVNTIYVQLMQVVGPERVAKFAKAHGLAAELGGPAGPKRDPRPLEKAPVLKPVLALSLGSGDVTTLQLASAFGTWANRGIHQAPHLVEKVVDSKGRVLEDHRGQQGTQVIAREHADTMNLVLRGAVENGTGTAARLYGREVAGKTGTTSDYTDARFVGYTTDLVTSVWLGFDDPKKKLVNVRGYDGISGGTLPAQIWHDFMDVATRNRPNQPFVQPEQLGGVVLNPTTTAPPVTVPPTTQPPGQPNPQPTFPPGQPGPSQPPPSLTLPGPGPARPGPRQARGMRAATAAGSRRGGPAWARARGRGRADAATVDWLVVGLWLLTRAVLLVVSLNPRLYSAALFGDVRFYGAKVERMFQGELPYRDVATEYPPGSVPFTILPGLVVGTGGGYRLAFACEMLLVDAVGLWAATRLARVVDAGRRRIPLAYVLAMVAVGPLLVLRFDIVPAVCVLLAAAMAAEGRFGWAAAALGYGTAAKIFPGVLAPLLVLGLVPALGWWRSFTRTVPPFLAGFGLTVVPALVLSVRGTADSVLYHVQRGADREPLGQPDRHRPPVRAARPDRVRVRRLRPRLQRLGGRQGPVGVATLAALAGAAWLVWRRARTRAGSGRPTGPAPSPSGPSPSSCPPGCCRPSTWSGCAPPWSGWPCSSPAGGRSGRWSRPPW